MPPYNVRRESGENRRSARADIQSAPTANRRPVRSAGRLAPGGGRADVGIGPYGKACGSAKKPGPAAAGPGKGKTELLVVDGVHVLDELQDLVGVTDLVVVPGDDLHEGVGQSDAGLGVEDGGAGVAQEVGGDNGILGVTQNALQLALGGFLHGGADLIIGGGLGQVAGQVHDGDVQGGNTHGHAGQLAIQLGDNLADSLGGAGGGG